MLAAATPLALLEGCARVPTGGEDARETRYAAVTMRVAGRIRQTSEEGPPFSYFFLVNFVDDINADSGPAPINVLPWNNGIAAPAPSPADSQGFVGFVVFGGPANQGRFGVYQVPLDNGIPRNVAQLGPGLTGFLPLGVPDNPSIPEVGGNFLSFRLNLGIFDELFYRMDATGNRTRIPGFLQFNFVNTDNFPVDPNDNNALKTWDSLGNANTEPNLGKGVPGVVRGIPLNQTGQPYDNSTIVSINPNSVEGAGDVWDRQTRPINEPDLDIIEWSVRVSSN